MKKIVFVTISMRGGGTERVISVLANYYVSHGMEVSILMIADNRIEYELDNRIKVISVSKATGGNLTERIKRVIRIRRYYKKNPDAGIIAMGTVAAMFALLAKVGMKCKVVISERNDPNRLNHKPISLPAKMLRNILYRRAQAIVLQTEDVKKCFPSYLARKSVVIPNPLSDKIPEAHINFRRNKSVITAGRLTEQKNHRLLIDAFCDFYKKHSDYRLYIYGNGELEYCLKEYIKTIQMEEQIFLCGFCNDLYSKLQTEGIYVSCSDWEGISNSLIEALALGIPTIATDCPMGGSRMFINNMENGILISVNNREELTQAMNLIAQNEKFGLNLSTEAVRIRKVLSVDKIADTWLKLFAE